MLIGVDRDVLRMGRLAERRIRTIFIVALLKRAAGALLWWQLVINDDVVVVVIVVVVVGCGNWGSRDHGWCTVDGSEHGSDGYGPASIIDSRPDCCKGGDIRHIGGGGSGDGRLAIKNARRHGRTCAQEQEPCGCGEGGNGREHYAATWAVVRSFSTIGCIGTWGTS